MEAPKSLDSLFKDKIFRIPDYQRGYAWQREQLKDFWEDLVNLSGNRSHYTGVLTMKQIPKQEIASDAKEHWLVKDHSYSVHQIVDGQQRLTTFIIFLQAFVDFTKKLPGNVTKSNSDIYITESLSLADLESRYLFKVKPTGDKFRTYKFGYTRDNPSYNYLRYKILGEIGGGSIEETFYTLNLSNAHIYFFEQLEEMYLDSGVGGLSDVYEKITQRFMFNEYVIDDEYDVFVAFETMNNRGKKLSDLELLKNRLIYLTTLYDESELDEASRKSLRDDINDAWKEVYHQLGRNKKKPLNDDDFLRAHWTMYFKYSRQTGRDYIRFLLDEQFSPKKVNKKVERPVILEAPVEMRSDDGLEESEEEVEETVEELIFISSAQLRPTEIANFVKSLKESAAHWFNSFYPELADGMSVEERRWIDCINRVGIVYFRPLLMAVMKNEANLIRRVRTFQKIERFIFIVFRMNSARANYGSSEFYNLARALDRGEKGIDSIIERLEERLDYTYNEDGSLWKDDFQNMIVKKFKRGSGYYAWPGLRYFLYEYETSLLAESRQKKVDWSDLLKGEKDRISIEHIYPQTETKEWKKVFEGIIKKEREYYKASLGNLLLLSMSINSSLQNIAFEEKKGVRLGQNGEKVRNGYADGSHSEIEVSRYEKWGPREIWNRGIVLLKFMEKRWDFKFASDDEREELLLLSYEENDD